MSLTLNNMFVIKYRKIFYAISTLLILLSIVAISIGGIKFGTDFTGGSILEFKVDGPRIDKSKIEDTIKNSGIDVGTFTLRETGDFGYALRTKNITNPQKDELVTKIDAIDSNNVSITKFSDIGPTVGKELQSRAIMAIIVVALLIILFVAFAFRKVSKPVSSWVYGFVTIITFIHDVLIPIGLFAILGHFGIEVDTLFVVAVLVVLGYSINDTIVVFDRVRENLGNIDEKQRDSQFEHIVGKGLKETMIRSLNTSLTTLIGLFAIFFLGGEVTKYFALAMIAGVIAGTYSSIFIAAPLLVTIKRYKDKKAAK